MIFIPFNLKIHPYIRSYPIVAQGVLCSSPFWPQPPSHPARRFAFRAAAVEATSRLRARIDRGALGRDHPFISLPSWGWAAGISMVNNCQITSIPHSFQEKKTMEVYGYHMPTIKWRNYMVNVYFLSVIDFPKWTSTWLPIIDSVRYDSFHHQLHWNDPLEQSYGYDTSNGGCKTMLRCAMCWKIYSRVLYILL